MNNNIFKTFWTSKYVDLICAFCAVLLTLFVLREYLAPNIYHSSGPDQQFLLPSMLHGARLAWIGEGSFFFNYVTAEPIWANPHFSPFYPFYGSITVILYDVFGVEDYMVIGNYITVFHRLVLALGCYYLSRTLSSSRLIAICVAIFIAGSEAARIPGNFYMAASAYAWVPFMIGACVDIYFFRFSRGIAVLSAATVLSVYAAPVYLGLGVAILPCATILFAFLVRFWIETRASESEGAMARARLTIGWLVLAAIGLVAMLLPVLLAVFLGSEDLVRWLRTGPVIGRSTISVGSELFYETQGFDYLKRVVTDYGQRGIFSSYFLGSLGAFVLSASPYLWYLKSRYHDKSWLYIRFILWGLAILHLSFIFGEKLILPKILYAVPISNAIRHLSAFGSVFIILAGICIFDAVRTSVEIFAKPPESQRDEKTKLIIHIVMGLLLAGLSVLIFIYAGHRFFLPFLLIIFFICLFAVRKFSGAENMRRAVALLVIGAFFTLSTYEQQTTKFNTPASGATYINDVNQIQALIEGISVDGELVNSKLSSEFSKSRRLNGMQIQSYLSLHSFRSVMSYNSPRHYERFRSGMTVWIGDLETMRRNGVTLLIADKEKGKEYEKSESGGTSLNVVKSTADYTLYRLQPSASRRADGICLDHNVCGVITDDIVDLEIFPYDEIIFKRSDGANLFPIKVAGQPTLSRIVYKADSALMIAYRPRGLKILSILALLGFFLSLTSVYRVGNYALHKSPRDSGRPS